jgi:hypothetical protein
MTANTDVSSAIVRSLIPARMDRLPWARFHTRLVMSLGTAWILFFAIAQVFGAVGPILFGALIGAGNNPSRLFIGYAIGGGLMIVGGIVALLLGVAAERKELEQIASPLTAVTATQVPRAPMPRAHYSPNSRPGGPSSAAA